MKKLRFLIGYLMIRPRRWLFMMMVSNTCPQWLPKHHHYFGWLWPNIHWWILYRTVFNFCSWLNYDAWRPFCNWTGGWRQSYPWYAHLIHRIGHTTAGYAISGGECYNCGSPDGCQVDLAYEDDGKNFRLTSKGYGGTYFTGITTCPKCGYQGEFEDGGE